MEIKNLNTFKLQKANYSGMPAKCQSGNNFIKPAFCSKIGILDYRTAENNLKSILKDDFKNPIKAMMKGKISIKEFFKNRGNYDNLAQLKGCQYADSHKWTDEELEMIEGLQYNLPTLKNMNMKQIYVALYGMHNKNLFFPVVRGCYHKCSYCFLDALAPIKRCSFEDFKNTIDDLSEISKRMLLKPNKKADKRTVSFLFYDSDGSQIFLKDKTGKIHEFPELNSMIFDFTGSKGVFDTAGWNPKNKEIQMRMERLVSYYRNNEKELDKISTFNLSINPFEGLYDKAVQYKQKGNLEGFERLKKLYVDMVVNMLTTFAPLIKNEKVNILCRAYPDSVLNSAYNEYKHSDVVELKKEIIEKYIEKNNGNDIQNLARQEILESIFHVNSDSIIKGGRNNAFKSFITQTEANFWDECRKYYKNKKNNAMRQKSTLIDINGKIYFGNDFYLCGTDLQLNYENPIEKKLNLSILPDIVIFK